MLNSLIIPVVGKLNIIITKKIINNDKNNLTYFFYKNSPFGRDYPLAKEGKFSHPKSMKARFGHPWLIWLSLTELARSEWPDWSSTVLLKKILM